MKLATAMRGDAMLAVCSCHHLTDVRRGLQQLLLLLLFSIVNFGRSIDAPSRSCTWRSDRQLDQLAAWSSPRPALTELLAVG